MRSKCLESFSKTPDCSSRTFFVTFCQADTFQEQCGFDRKTNLFDSRNRLREYNRLIEYFALRSNEIYLIPVDIFSLVILSHIQVNIY